MSHNKPSYEDLLASKIIIAERNGISCNVADLHPSTKPHQAVSIEWALERGAALVAADCGLGKTHINIEVLRLVLKYVGAKGGKCLIVTELGASETYINPDPEIGEGARLGIKLDYVTNQEEALASDCDIIVTNYERVRMGAFDFSQFLAVWLDEGNYIKNMASNTTNELQKQLSKVKYKWIATATPAPNQILELVNYAHVLGVCDRGQILTRFFKRNSTKAGELSLMPEHASDFWMWVYSWALFITDPADLGFDSEGYDLPEPTIHWCEVDMKSVVASQPDRDGVQKMFVDSVDGLSAASKIKQQSIGVRLDKAFDIIAQDTEAHYIIWHHLENERKAIAKEFAVINKGLEVPVYYADLYGSLDWKERENRIVQFSKGELQVLGTKPEISSVGCNFQKHCHKAIFLGINDSFDDWYQAMRRIWRYPQDKQVEVYMIYVREEYNRVLNLQRKMEEHKQQRAELRKIIRKYGLYQSRFIEEKRRSFKTQKQVYKGENYELVCNDCVYEYREVADNSIDLHLSSFPFGNHYEYTDKYNDFGHNQTNQAFIKQLGYLLPELYRTLKPGRIIAVHLKNRIHYGSVTGLGFSVMHRFTHLVCDAMEAHGFHTMGFHYIPTCVVAENNQTYRLTYGEMKKDSTKMGAGIPEEIWIFRKPPTTNDNAYADEPVTHDENYSLADWQLDADSFWQTSGNRYLTPDELKGVGLDKLQRWWKEHNKNNTYNHEEHVAFLQLLDKSRKLSRTFTTLPLQSRTPFIWPNINRMNGLNVQQRLRKKQNHICPMPFDEVDRLIELYSNPGEVVSDPFSGIGTTLIRAVKKGRKAFGTELNDMYAECAAAYLRDTEYQMNIPTLFKY